MAKRSQNTTRTIENKLKKGCGQGHGKDYKPWLSVRDVPSKGLTSRDRGWKTGRTHLFLSELESDCCYHFEWATNVIDIREQYALGMDQTLDIAERLGIKHSHELTTNEPKVVTTDFLLDIFDGQEIKNIAISVKKRDDLSSRRVIEKQAIERAYWMSEGIPWYIITESELYPELVENMKWIYKAKELTDYPHITPNRLKQAEMVLFKRISRENEPLSHVTSEMDDRLGLEPGTSLTIVRHLIANRIWNIDIMRQIHTERPLYILGRHDGLLEVKDS